MLYGSRAEEDNRPLLPHDTDDPLDDCQRDYHSLCASMPEDEGDKMNQDFEVLHYGIPNQIGKAVIAAHGPRAWYQVGHKGNIHVYVPLRNDNASTKVASYSSIEEIRDARKNRKR